MSTTRMPPVRIESTQPAGALANCPLCDSEISTAKLDEIHEKIREEEKREQKRLSEKFKKKLQIANQAKEKAEQQRIQLVQQSKEREAALRKQFQNESDKKVSGATKKLRESLRQESQKELQVARRAKQKAEEERDQAIQSTKNQEAAILKRVRKESDKKTQEDLSKMREVLTKDHDRELFKKHSEHIREKESLIKQTNLLKRKLEQKRPTELGEGAEIDVYDDLRNAFPRDDIRRIAKGEPGADISHEVIYKGQSCGTILYDSKNHQQWRSSFVEKLRKDQLVVKADHAILTTTVFPSREKELCILDDVVVVNPGRVTHMVRVLRDSMISVHRLGLSAGEKKEKTEKLYKFITSKAYGQLSKEASDLAEALLEVDVDEQKQHRKVWTKRGELTRRLQDTLEETGTQIGAIVEGI